MRSRYWLLVLLVLASKVMWAAVFSGRVTGPANKALSQVKVYILEDKKTLFTDNDGAWFVELDDDLPKTIVFSKAGFTYEQLLAVAPDTDIQVQLRKALTSAASLREAEYIKNNCAQVQVPNNNNWNAAFVISELKGDLAPNSTYTRRDPSSVIKVDNTYYMWYSYNLTHDSTKIAPWDLCDLYYASSPDGITWHEQGVAVTRGKPGAFDARSVFTTEVFVHAGKYYLIYQAAADKNGIYKRNTVGMATANSPKGPWVKLPKPVLHPTYTDELFFDNTAVHDPCIVAYNNKFYLYYKGECNCQQNDSCQKWCNPICGFRKQVKWGVAVADKPTGPYVKSAANPVTNTGHEVMVWLYKNGVAILQHQDGPEPNTIQFAENGTDFQLMGKVTGIPEAAGLYRAQKSDTNPHAGINWGVGHKLMWNDGPKGWMYIYRFDNISKPTRMTSSATKINKAAAATIDLTGKKLLVRGTKRKYKLSVLTLDGKTCYAKKHRRNASIDLSTYDPGIYNVKLKAGKVVYEKKLLLK